MLVGGAEKYYGKRFRRINIPYLFVYVPYAFVLFFLGVYTVCDCFLSMAALEYWFYHRGAWFVSTILCLYLISPFLYQLLNGSHRFLYATFFVVIIMILIKIPIGDQVNTNILYNIQVAMSRVPCFILGMTVGKESKEHKRCPCYGLFQR